MWEKKPQTFDNHARLVPPYHFGVSLILLINLLWTGWRLIQPLFSDAAFSFSRVMGFLLALAFIGLFWYCRIFPLAAQDRVIRLEMRLRLAELLPEDLRQRAGDLTPGQLVALRFAGDEELPDLVRAVLDEGIAGGKEIKQRIKSWRPDYFRV